MSGLLKQFLGSFDRIGGYMDEAMKGSRREGFDKRFAFSDAIKGAFGVFFFQHPSMLEYQQRLKDKRGRSNAENIL
jgi:hypothetical protein